VTADENGKSKVSVGKRKAAPRTKASANTRRDGPNGGGKENEQPAEEAFEDVDPDEPRYCICGDVSFGTMIACENDEVSTPKWKTPVLDLLKVSTVRKGMVSSRLYWSPRNSTATIEMVLCRLLQGAG
jgi:hypothetical protein